MNGANLYKAIAKRETASQKWNDLTDEERLKYTRLAEGVEALVFLHKVSVQEVAKYLMQYVKFKELEQ